MVKKQKKEISSKLHKEAAKSLEHATERNIAEIVEIENAQRKVRTPAERLSEAIARFCGSMTFVWVHIIWFGVWTVINIFPGLAHIDPFPFTFLTLVVSLEAIFLSTFILISQNHDAKISERRNHLDLQINLLSEQENTKMLAMLRAIAAKVGADLEEDPHLEAMSAETEPEKVVQQIQAREER
jgi:uncharacterized membrane protein